MISILRKLLGRHKPDLAQLIRDGAAIVDVRTRQEFNAGHVKGSSNIPLDQVEASAKKLQKHPSVILCCRSGSRSAYATQILKRAGVVNAVNGGSWQSVNAALNTINSPHTPVK